MGVRGGLKQKKSGDLEYELQQTLVLQYSSGGGVKEFLRMLRSGYRYEVPTRSESAYRIAQSRQMTKPHAWVKPILLPAFLDVVWGYLTSGSGILVAPTDIFVGP